MAASLEQTIGEAAVAVIGNGRKSTDYLIQETLRLFVLKVLEADPRFVRGPGGNWELAHVREERQRAFVGEPVEDRSAGSQAGARAPRKRAAA